MPLSRAIDTFLEARRARQRPNTVWNDESFLKTHLLALGRSRALSDMRLRDLQALFDDLSRKGYEPSTLGQYRNHARAFFGHFGLDTAQEIEIAAVSEKDVRTWDPDEIEMLRAEAAKLGREDERLLALALSTGGRKSELGALRREYFSPVKRSVRFRQQVDEYGNLQMLKDKRAGTALVLPEWWDWQEDGRGFVMGEAWRPSRVYWRLKRIVKNASLYEQGLGVHVFRHTYARRVLEAGCSLEQLRAYLRHASIRTTERFYGHLRDDVALAMGRARLYGEVAQDPDTRAENPRPRLIS